ncbi:MAG: hypothetical protein KKA31_02635 [Candidatus Margulisbacteria bacterium]|nr:hypothetical protein [Candidatus Margulisiibacteriota bacterium]
MHNKTQDNKNNTLTIDGITFKTTGNINFPDAEESPFLLAQSSLLDNMSGVLEHGMQMLMKKMKA